MKSSVTRDCVAGRNVQTNVSAVEDVGKGDEVASAGCLVRLVLSDDQGAVDVGLDGDDRHRGRQDAGVGIPQSSPGLRYIAM